MLLVRQRCCTFLCSWPTPIPP